MGAGIPASPYPSTNLGNGVEVRALSWNPALPASGHQDPAPRVHSSLSSVHLDMWQRKGPACEGPGMLEPQAYLFRHTRSYGDVVNIEKFIQNFNFPAQVR